MGSPDGWGGEVRQCENPAPGSDTVGKAKPRRLERSKLVKGANDRKGRKIKQGQGGNLETKDIFISPSS